MAYVYIQYLNPTHSNSLFNIKGRETEMKVREAKNLLYTDDYLIMSVVIWGLLFEIINPKTGKSYLKLIILK